MVGTTSLTLAVRAEGILSRRQKLEILFRNPAHLELHSPGTQLLLAKWVVKDFENSFRQRFVITYWYQWAKGPLLENLGRTARAVCADNRTSASQSFDQHIRTAFPCR